MNLQIKYGVLLFFFVTQCFCRWKQDAFIIGGFFDPTGKFDGIAFSPIPDSPTEHDLKLLRDFKYAYFNLLTCTGKSPELVDTYQEIIYALKAVEKVDGLHLLCRDWRIEGNTFLSNVTDMKKAVQEYKNIPPRLRKYLYGYMVADEPHYSQTTVGSDLITKLTIIQTDTLIGDPEKLCYLNLFSNRVPPNFFNTNDATYNTNVYIDYISRVCKAGAQIISFDNYCFLKASDKAIYLRDKFFENNRIAAEQAAVHGVTFWGMALSTEHVRYNAQGKIFKDYDGPADYRTDFTFAQLKFHAYVPVVYGAKGIVWFEYRPEKPYSSHADSFQKKGWHFNNKAIIDDRNKKVDYGSKPLYLWVRKINLTLKNMGPTIMKLSWIGTFHGAESNNFPSIKATNRDKPYRLTRNYFESGLPTISDIKNDLISKVITQLKDAINTLMLGIFRQGDIYYLVIMNKDIYKSHTYTVIFNKKLSSFWRHKKNSNTWSSIKGTTEFSITIEPGDIELVRLGDK